MKSRGHVFESSKNDPLKNLFLSTFQNCQNSLGGEMLTYVKSGFLVGIFIGGFVGLLIAPMLSLDLLVIDTLNPLRLKAPFLFYFLMISLTTLVGGVSGALVGISVPRYNPHPEQGVNRNQEQSQRSEKRSEKRSKKREK